MNLCARLLPPRLWLIALVCGPGTPLPRAAETIDAPELFITHCAPCHGPDGRARTPAARKLCVKDLTESKLADPEIRRQITEGKNDKGGKQLMPSFREKLHGDEITALIAEVKKFRK